MWLLKLAALSEGLCPNVSHVCVSEELLLLTVFSRGCVAKKEQKAVCKTIIQEKPSTRPNTLHHARAAFPRPGYPTGQAIPQGQATPG